MMNLRLKTLAVGLLVAGAMGLAGTAGAQSPAGPAVQTVAWHGWHGGWRGHGWWGPGAVVGGIAGGALAAATGPWGSGYDYGYAPGYDSGYAPGYDSYGYAAPSYGYAAPSYGYAAPGYSAYCMSRFRSYDRASGTYLGYDGIRHSCP